jgi:hypothetical protein
MYASFLCLCSPKLIEALRRSDSPCKEHYQMSTSKTHKPENGALGSTGPEDREIRLAKMSYTVLIKWGGRGRFQWPCFLRQGSGAARLPGLRAQIPPTAWMSVACVVGCQAERCVRRADHSSRGVLPTVVCHCVWSRSLKNETRLTRLGCCAIERKN